MTPPEPPELIPFLLRHAANGAAGGALAVLAAIRLDLLGLGAMLEGDASGLATALVIGQIALLTATVNAAAAVMALGRDPD